MNDPKKKLRYYYWLVIEFLKKHFKLIILAFFLSFFLFSVLVIVYPFFEETILIKKETIGILDNNYNLKKLPTEISKKVSNGLILINNGNIIPVLIKNWQVKENGKKFILKLKNNLVWNDGKDVSANQIKINFKNVKLSTPDKYTLIFQLPSPLPIFINYLDIPVFRDYFVGIGGLYSISKVKYLNNNFKEIYLMPNKKNLPAISYRFYQSDDQLVTAYKKGEITSFETINEALALPFYKWKNTKVEKKVNYDQQYTLFFNLNNPILKERNIRTALRMAIDINVFKNKGQPSLSSIPPTSWAYNKDLEPWIYDPNTAKEIIFKLASQSANLNLYTYYDNVELADLINELFQKIGVKIDIHYLNQPLPPPNFDLFLILWKQTEDPDQYIFWHSSQKNTNISNYLNLKVDKLLEDGRKTISISERKAMYQSLQKTLYDDPPAIFLYFPFKYEIKRR